MSTSFLLYGAYGYTGKLIARAALEHGLRPILAGRDPARLQPLAAELGVSHRAFAVEDAAAAEAALAEVVLVLNCAGPFARTALPLASACLWTGTHYLDITGEWRVFQALAERDEEAKEKAVMLLPGVGFDALASDSLAAHLARRLPSASRLALGLQFASPASRGSLRTALEGLGSGTVVRRGGRLDSLPLGGDARRIDFGRGPVWSAAIPWGDVVTAYYSTGIPNITVYAASPGPLRLGVLAARRLSWLTSAAPVRALLRRFVATRPPGPTAAQRAQGESVLWGEVTDERGGRAVSRLRVGSPYGATVDMALAAVARALAGTVQAGFQTPSLAFGADFALEIPGVAREDVE